MGNNKILDEVIDRLYSVVAELEHMYPGRHFTPDGHMVGSLGEVVAAERYGLELLDASYPVHDAKTPDGKLVQIKTTQGAKIAISECPDYLIVLQLSKEEKFAKIYNGPGTEPWNSSGKMQKTGQRHISVSRLIDLSQTVKDEDRIALSDGSDACCKD